MLSSEGFKFGRLISKKIVVLYELMAQQLSKQDHYDFGLRALTSVLRYAGKKKRTNANMAVGSQALCSKLILSNCFIFQPKKREFEEFKADSRLITRPNL